MSGPAPELAPGGTRGLMDRVVMYEGMPVTLRIAMKIAHRERPGWPAQIEALALPTAPAGTTPMREAAVLEHLADRELEIVYPPVAQIMFPRARDI